MKVRFWGTRGSIAAPGSHTVELGGNTACVEVGAGTKRSFVLDCGTGVIEYAGHVMGEAARTGSSLAEREFHFVVSHFHWDHIIGFPFFHPIHVPGVKICVHSPFEAEELETHIRALFDGTYSPLRNMDNLNANISFHQIPLEGGTLQGMDLRCQLVDHSEPCYGIRVSDGDSSFTYLTDHEARPGAKNEAVVEFAKGSDLLVHDGQFTAAEYQEHQDWGHSSMDNAIQNGIVAKVKQLLIFHHDPSHADDDRRLYLARYLREHPIEKGGPVVDFARENTTVDVGNS